MQTSSVLLTTDSGGTTFLDHMVAGSNLNVISLDARAPNARVPFPSVRRKVAPRRGANRFFCIEMPRSVGTPPRPPISILFVSRLYRSRPRSPPRVGIGKYSYRAPKDSVTLGLTCH